LKLRNLNWRLKSLGMDIYLNYNQHFKAESDYKTGQTKQAKVKRTWKRN
jgi:hypothetical protein